MKTTDKETDRALIDKLGGTRGVAEALELDGQTVEKKIETIKKWRQNGIPWRWRSKVQQLAKQKRKRLPADFLEQRRAA